uniref:AN1-type domain-containing protein n=1 Tax=Florenciella sp. virus SA2 TaxID=3240092 RepID=A0AB39JBB2_9VIRU
MEKTQENLTPLLHKKCFVCKKKRQICFKCSHCHKICCINHKMPEQHECNHTYEKLSIIHQKTETCKIIKI